MIPVSLSTPGLQKQQSAIRTQIPDIWRIESFLQAVSKLLWEHMHSCLLGSERVWEWVAATILSLNWLKLNTIYPTGLPLEVSSLQKTSEL